MANQSLTASAVSFNFESHAVRAINKYGECWFIAADVCAVLDIKNTTQALAALDDDERSMFNIGRSAINGGGGEVNIINESGLYALILRSRKPEAKRFRKWVTSEVLPAIRKTGAYIHASAMRPALTPEQCQEIRVEINRMTGGWLKLDEKWIYNHLRVAFHVPKWEDIPQDLFPIVQKLIESKRDAVHQFYSVIREARAWFCRDCLGAGLPWTPSIKAKLHKQLKRSVVLPPKVDWLALADQTKKSPAKTGKAKRGAK